MSFVAFTAGAHAEAAPAWEQTGAIARSAGRLGDAAFYLGGAAFLYMAAGDTEAARRVALDGLQLARETGTPSGIVSNLNALAGALLDEDPQKAEALFDEAVQLRKRLGYESAAEATQAAILSARLERWPDVFAFAGTAIRMFHWVNDWPNLSGLFNLVARALTSTDPETAAVLQGIAFQFATGLQNTPRQPRRAPSTSPTADAPLRWCGDHHSDSPRHHRAPHPIPRRDQPPATPRPGPSNGRRSRRRIHAQCNRVRKIGDSDRR